MAHCIFILRLGLLKGDLSKARRLLSTAAYAQSLGQTENAWNLGALVIGAEFPGTP